MDELVTVAADGFQVLNAVSSTVRPVFAVMNLQVAARATPGASPAMLLHGLAAVDEVHAMHERPKRYEISFADGFDDQLVALEGPHRAHASFRRKFADLVSCQPFRSLLGHNALG
jgi:hypothetical protein